MRSVLCEGGPTLNSHLFAAGLVDELFLTLNPKVAGRRERPHDRRGHASSWSPPSRELVSVAEHEGELFTRWRFSHAIVQKLLHLSRNRGLFR